MQSKEPHRRFALIHKILALSADSTWNEARTEWELVRVFFAQGDVLGTCLCGHYPIREQCELRNRMTGARVVVGNVCVTRFLKLESEELFASFRRIMQNTEAALGLRAIEYAFRNDWINDWEYKFYVATYRKRRRSLSPGQIAKRIEINRKIIRLLDDEEAEHA